MHESQRSNANAREASMQQYVHVFDNWERIYASASMLTVQRVQQYRIQKKLSTGDLAGLLMCDVKDIEMFETGVRTLPRAIEEQLGRLISPKTTDRVRR
jgi:DNA-binding transcriptional regulator YiaG